MIMIMIILIIIIMIIMIIMIIIIVILVITTLMILMINSIIRVIMIMLIHALGATQRRSHPQKSCIITCDTFKLLWISSVLCIFRKFLHLINPHLMYSI